LNSGNISARAIYNNHQVITANIYSLLSINISANGKVNNAQNIHPKAAK